MQNKNTFFRMVATLVIIAVVLAAALAFVNRMTLPQIQKNNEDQLQESLRTVIKANTFDQIEQSEETTVYQAKNGDETVGYCVVNSQKGYGASVKVLTGINLDGEITAVEILEHSETPGLGANCEKDAFKGQYSGKVGKLLVVKFNPDSQSIQAISGATITSKAVTDAVNFATEKILQLETQRSGAQEKEGEKK